MNIRLKSYVTIQRIKNSISISGCIGKDLLFEYNDNNITLLNSLSTESGICPDKLINCHLFQQLKENALLEETPSKELKRNEAYYQYANINFNKIREKRILVLGAGAAGGTITYLLSQQGFTNIMCVDDDKVEVGDVEKTMVYNISDIGKYKVEALWQRVMSNFNIDIKQQRSRLSTASQVRKIIESYSPDIIVYAIDPAPSFKLVLNQLCIRLNVPIIHASYSYEKILCGPCVVPHQTACMVGYNEYWRKRTNNTFDFYDISKISSSRLVHPSISFNINTLSSIVLKDIIFCLSGNFEIVSTFNRLLIINLLTSDISVNELSCKFCSTCEAKRTVDGI